MASVADDLRNRTRLHGRALPVAGRIQIALALGDDDADRYGRAQGLDRADAIRVLRRRRARGRQPSAAADVP